MASTFVPVAGWKVGSTWCNTQNTTLYTIGNLQGISSGAYRVKWSSWTYLDKNVQGADCCDYRDIFPAMWWCTVWSFPFKLKPLNFRQNLSIAEME